MPYQTALGSAVPAVTCWWGLVCTSSTSPGTDVSTVTLHYDSVLLHFAPGVTLLQVFIDGVMSLALCLQVVSQDI